MCYIDFYRYMLTCGQDGDVRVWEGIDDDDAVSHKVGDKAFAIVFKVIYIYIIKVQAVVSI